MTPAQREATERLAAALDDLHSPFDIEATVTLLRELAAEPVQEPAIWIQSNHLQHAKNGPYLARTGPTKLMSDFIPLYAAPQQRKPLTTAMEAEIEGDCLVAWNASIYGHSAHDTVHPMFLSAFIRGYRAAECAHGIGEAP